MTQKRYTEIPRRQKCVNKEEPYIGGAGDIIDDVKGKTQEQVNKETDDTLALHQSEINAHIRQNYVTVATYASLPAPGAVDTIYRVSSYDGTQVDATKYAEYAWNGSAYVLLDVKTQVGEVFDISQYKAVGGTLATFADLSAALDNGNNVPVGVRRGGMSVKYVQSSDNKYIQARCMAQSFTTDVTQWQGVDDEPTADSDNLVKSGGVEEVTSFLSSLIGKDSLLEKSSLDGCYIKRTTGKITSLSGYKTAYTYALKGDLIVVIGYLSTTAGGVGLFLNEPSINAVANMYFEVASKVFIMPFDGYIVTSRLGSSFNQLCTYKVTADINDVGRINDLIEKTKVYSGEDGSFGGYINSSGVVTNSAPSFNTLYKKVYKGDIIEFEGKTTGSYRAAFSNSAPLLQSESVMTVLPDTITSPYIAEYSGYFLISADSSSNLSLRAKTIPNLLKELSDILHIIDYETSDIRHIIDYETIAEYTDKVQSGQFNAYLKDNGTWANVGSTNFITKYYSVTKGEFLKVRHGSLASSSTFAKYGFFTEVPTTSSVPYSYSPAVPGQPIDYVEAPITGYIAVSSGTNQELYCKTASDTTIEKVVSQLQEDVSGVLSGYYKKTCLYIGDSLSTKNNYHWKGYLEDAYKLYYARDISGQLAPANGGITVVPLEADESETPIATTSIWYRCANNRMSIYNFDFISLFGGINDMAHDYLTIGTVNDLPYVDDASSFETPANYTDVWTNSLTFAQCLMGCIEMLKRDFPTKEIVLCTVMPCEGRFGNWTDPVSGLRASEAIAELQVNIAVKYDLKIVPFYWNVRTYETATRRVFSTDGVHPNKPCALRMRAAFAEILCL